MPIVFDCFLLRGPQILVTMCVHCIISTRSLEDFARCKCGAQYYITDDSCAQKPDDIIYYFGKCTDCVFNSRDDKNYYQFYLAGK